MTLIVSSEFLLSSDDVNLLLDQAHKDLDDLLNCLGNKKSTGIRKTLRKTVASLFGTVHKVSNAYLYNISVKKHAQACTDSLRRACVNLESIANNKDIKTFSEVTARPKPKNKRVPKLIIRKTNNNDNTDLEKTVLQHITSDKAIQTKSVSCKNKDTVIINCMKEENINSLVNSLGEKLSNNFKIEKEEFEKPKLK